MKTHNTPIDMRFTLTLFIAALSGSFASLSAQSYTSFLTGSSDDLDVQPNFGIVLMGGAGEDDEAMKWFLERANGGDVVVIRTSGSDGYNNYMFNSLGVTLNSVETIVFNNASAAQDPYVIERLQGAEAIWMAGGNQATYVGFWQGTPVEDAINDLLNVRGGVVGGISAGMAVLGGSYFAALNGTVTSAQALANPFAPNMTLGHDDFIHAPYLENVITDTHYDDPDRRGRHAAFMARISVDTQKVPLGIACDEYAAVCIGANGIAHCYGEAPQYDDYVYFVRPACDVPLTPNQCEPDAPLDWNHGGQALKALRINATADGSQYLDLNDWVTHNGGDWFDWTVTNGMFDQSPGSAPECALATNVVEDHQDGALMAYPNPVSDVLYVETLPGDLITVYGLTGRMVYQTTATATRTTLNMGHLVRGVYVVHSGGMRVKVVRE
jgi:cyanophycinase-like exopeptidase